MADLYDLLYQGWGVIANVSEGDWSKQTPEWRGYAKQISQEASEASDA